MAGTYLGYRTGDAATEWGSFFNPEMAALPSHIVTALEHGPQAAPVLLDFDDAATILDEGYQQTENGYGHLRDGGIQVSARTDMPGVTPQMWSWWFGWHGSDARRYKLWHPRAHVSARWDDDGPDGHYVGRTSLIEEYIGSAFTKGAIAFVEPSALGLDPAKLGEGIAVCARLGSSDLPVDVGWFVHHVRPTADGQRDAIPVLDGWPARGGARRQPTGGSGGAADRGTPAARPEGPDGALRAGDESPGRLPAGDLRQVHGQLVLTFQPAVPKLTRR